MSYHSLLDLLPSRPALTPYTPLTALGALTALYSASSLLSFLYHHALHRSGLPRYLSADPSTSHPWALVTGASDGIGKALAAELLGAGFSVVLHGRNRSKLDGVRAELLAEFPSAAADDRVLVVVCDASTAGEKEVKAMVDQLGGRKITVLMNNVGGTPAYPAHRPFADHDGDTLDRYLKMNVGMPLHLTRELMRREGALADRALIVNLSSGAGVLAIPYLSVYAGAKAFNNRWSQCLAEEMVAEGRDVEVISLIVGRVANQWQRDTFFGKPDARSFAKYVLQKVGSGRTEVTPYWLHAAQMWFIGCMPVWVQKKAMMDAARDGLETDRLHLESMQKQK